MPLYDLFKHLLGIPTHRPNDRESPYDEYNENNNPREDFRDFENTWRDSEEESNPRGFHFDVFSDPVTMHRYFEEQMNEMMRSFGGLFDHTNDSFFGGIFGDAAISPPPSSSQLPQIEPSTRNLREQLLKPGYENTKDYRPGTSKSDSDIDGKVNLTDLDDLLKEKPSRQVVPYQEPRQFSPQIRISGQSMSSKTIRNPDGSIETHNSVRKSDGSEETTVTKQLGEKRYTLTVRTDKNGRQERFEDMVNIDEKEIGQFNKNFEQKKQQPQQDLDFSTWFPLDKFFK